MLAPDDAKLVSRDRALPEMAVLLDPNRMAELIERLFDSHTLDSLTPNYVRYKPGTSCLVGYEARVNGRAVPLYARTHHAAAVEKVTKVMQRAHVPGPLGAGGAISHDPPIAIVVFPNDHELRVVRKLWDDKRRASKLRTLLPGHEAFHVSNLRVLRYKPERRLVACLTARDGSRAVLRVHAAAPASGIDTSRAASQDARQGTAELPSRTDADSMDDATAVRLPRHVGGSLDDRVAIYEWMNGEPLDAVLASTSVDGRVLERLAQSLARWHGNAGACKARKLAPVVVSGEIVDSIAAIDESLTERARSLAARIDAALSSVELPAVRIHGDFSAEQVILTERGFAFIDLDRSTTGAGIEDLATFRARLIADAIAGRWPLAAATAWSDRFAMSYQQHSGDLVAGHVTAAMNARALLRLASEPFRKRLQDWPSKGAQIVAAAEATCP